MSYAASFTRIALCTLLTGCGDCGGNDDSVLGTTSGSSGPSSTTTTNSTASGSSDDASSVDGGSETGSGENASCELIQAPSGSGPSVRQDAEALVVNVACNYSQLVDDENPQKLDPEQDFNVYVYRPADANGDWPSGGPRPAVFFVPGNGHLVVDDQTETDYYEELLPALAESGYVVFAGQPPQNSEGLSSGARMSMLACMMLWAQDETAAGWSEAANGRIGSAAIIAGHSRGGAAVNLLTQAFADLQGLMPGMDDYELCGSIAIAPTWNTSETISTEIFNNDPAAPPYLVLQGAIDEDTIGQGISAFDAMVPENDLSSTLQLSPRIHDKYLLWVYRVLHNDWGGIPTEDDGATSPDAIANFSGAHYIGRFLASVLYGDPDAYADLQVPLAASPGSSDFPGFLDNAALWNVVEPQYEDSGDRPLVFGTRVQGLEPIGASRLVVDGFSRANGSGGAIGLVCGESSLGDSALGLPVSLDGLAAANVCHGPAADLGNAAQSEWQRHQTRAASVAWGNKISGGAIEWDLLDGVSPTDAAGFSHVSLRVANLTDVTVTPEGLCDQAAPDSFELALELAAGTNVGTQVVASVPLGPSVEQEAKTVFSAATNENKCSASQMMRTVRIPMREFCDQGQFSPATLEALRVVFPDDPSASHTAMIDSIEFTRDPRDASNTLCGTQSAAWNCAATASLQIAATTCDTEPTPTCPPSGQRALSVGLLPEVPGGGGAFDGWVVHTLPGWVADPTNPTAAELTVIEDLCVQACELQWWKESLVDTAACDNSGSFATPTLRESPALAPVHRIPADRVHGEGIFASPPLDCDLQGDCCQAFDERICLARAKRVSPAGQPLGEGQEYLAFVGGTNSSLRLETPSDSAVMPVNGEVGYSFCPAGDTGSSCPFYLGSLVVDGTTAITLDDTCPDSSAFSVTLSGLSLELMQPAFGIADEASYAKAMPEGALHVKATFTANGNNYGVRAVNAEDVVFMTASRLEGAEVEDAVLAFDVPCGLGTIPVTATLNLDAVTVIEYPPTVVITTPPSVACPGTLALTASATDPDDDLEAIEWYVDDVLMDPGVGSIPMTQSHTLRVVARDARGAATTTTKSVACSP